MSDCACISVITDIFFALSPTMFTALNSCRYFAGQCRSSQDWITARFFLCRVAGGMFLGEFLDEFVERHKNIGSVAVTEKELVIYLVLLQFQRFLFHGDKKGFALRMESNSQYSIVTCYYLLSL